MLGYILFFLIPFAAPVFAELPSGQKPPLLELKGDQGHRLDGSAWSSAEIKDKVFVLFHVDPDESEVNDHVSIALKEQDFDKSRFGSIAIINMAATWKPNFAINMVLAKKQEEFPNTTYVRDMGRKVVSEWQLKDDSNNVVAFNARGEVIFSRDGKLSEKDVKNLVAAIKANLASN